MKKRKNGRCGFDRILGIFVLVFFVFGLTGCSSGVNYVKNLFGFGSDSQYMEGDEPVNLALKAQERMDADDYKEAAILYQQLKDQYPYSKYALLAELKLGDAYYLDGKYIEAYGAYRDFENLHPNNDAIPYALYQQGMSHFMLMYGQDRDQTPTILAIQTLARLVETFPDSQYAAMARARIAEAQNNLAGHEFYVGEFYFKRKDYQAALNRFIGLIKYYPDSGYHQRALNYIAQYRDMLDKGDINEGNQRPSAYNSPFSITGITDDNL